MAVTDGFVDAVLESPLGAALLAQLETRVRYPERRGLVLETDAGSVSAAAEAVSGMSFGALVELAVLTGWHDVGPWICDAGETVAVAHSQAEARAPIAEALEARFGAALHEPIEREAQQWWTTGEPRVDRLAPLFRNYELVYGAGQFTWAGLWTVSDPPEVAHAELAAARELEDGAISRWRLPVLPEARVLEVHRPADWARLVREHPRAEVSGQEGWELPGRTSSGPRCRCWRPLVASGRPARRCVVTLFPTGGRSGTTTTMCTCPGRASSPPKAASPTSTAVARHAALLVQRAHALARRYLR